MLTCSTHILNVLYTVYTYIYIYTKQLPEYTIVILLLPFVPDLSPLLWLCLDSCSCTLVHLKSTKFSECHEKAKCLFAVKLIKNSQEQWKDQIQWHGGICLLSFSFKSTAHHNKWLVFLYGLLCWHMNNAIYFLLSVTMFFLHDYITNVK